jgi:hypothetical protein
MIQRMLGRSTKFGFTPAASAVHDPHVKMTASNSCGHEINIHLLSAVNGYV